MMGIIRTINYGNLNMYKPEGKLANTYELLKNVGTLKKGTMFKVTDTVSTSYGHEFVSYNFGVKFYEEFMIDNKLLFAPRKDLDDMDEIIENITDTNNDDLVTQDDLDYLFGLK